MCPTNFTNLSGGFPSSKSGEWYSPILVIKMSSAAAPRSLLWFSVDPYMLYKAFSSIVLQSCRSSCHFSAVRASCFLEFSMPRNSTLTASALTVTVFWLPLVIGSISIFVFGSTKITNWEDDDYEGNDKNGGILGSLPE